MLNLKTILFLLFSVTAFSQSGGTPQFGLGTKKVGRGGGFLRNFAPSLQLDIGYSQVSYDEIVNITNDPNDELDTVISQNMMRYGVTAEVFILPGLLYVGGKLEKAVALNSETDKSSINNPAICCIFETKRESFHGGLVIPGTRPFNLTFLGEYFRTEMKTETTGYGIPTFNGTQFGVRGDLTSDSGISLYAQYYALQSVEGRNEFSGGIVFNIGGKPQGYPYSLFKTGYIFKVEYRKTTIKDEEEYIPEYELEAITGSLGFRF